MTHAAAGHARSRSTIRNSRGQCQGQQTRPPAPSPTERNGAGQAASSLVGPGRLERPTSRLSGVRSNQLSYRPESHPRTGSNAAPGLASSKEARARAGDPAVVRRDVQTAMAP